VFTVNISLPYGRFSLNLSPLVPLSDLVFSVHSDQILGGLYDRYTVSRPIAAWYGDR